MQSTTTPTYTPPPKEYFTLTKRDTVYICLLTVAAILVSALGIFGGFMLGWTVSFILLFVLGNLYICKKGAKLTPFAVCAAVLSVLVSVVFTVTTGGTVRFFAFVVSILLALAWCGTVTKNDTDGDLGVLGTMFAPIARLALPHIPTTVRSVFAGNGTKRNTVGKALLGILAAIPVLLIVIPLLVRADKAFDGLADLVQEDLLSLLWKVGVGILLALPVVSYCVSVQKRPLPRPTPIERKGVDNTALISFLSVLSVCYLAYLFSQLAYFFSAFDGLLPQGYDFTLAAYARRGFFEMCAVAAINAAIIFAALLLSRKRDQKPAVAVRILCTFISVFTLIIIATALSKMILYIRELGMTVLRIGTGTFTVLLAVMFIAIILRLYIPQVNVLKITLLTAGILVAALGIANLNRTVASYNYTAYQNSRLETIDVSTIRDMGGEGIPYLVALTKDDDPQVAEQAEKYVLQQFSNGKYYESECEYIDGEMQYFVQKQLHTNPSQYNIARARAYRALEYFADKNPHIIWETE